jgi:hypothetical protein
VVLARDPLIEDHGDGDLGTVQNRPR